MLLKVSYAYKGFIYLIQIYFIIIILKYYLFEYILQFIYTFLHFITVMTKISQLLKFVK